MEVWAGADGRRSAEYVLAEVNRKWLAVEVLAGITGRWSAVKVLAEVDRSWLPAGFGQDLHRQPLSVNYSQDIQIHGLS